jgi:hypothetical protein
MTPEEQKEEATWKRRYQKLVQEGLGQDEAHELAAQLMMRDRDPMDDRRICLECVYHENKHCTKMLYRWKPSQQLRFILQRCDHFAMKGGK